MTNKNRETIKKMWIHKSVIQILKPMISVLEFSFSSIINSPKWHMLLIKTKYFYKHIKISQLQTVFSLITFEIFDSKTKLQPLNSRCFK